jgi:ATP-dependent DNA helicase RecQ
MSTPLEILKSYWGYPSFRPLQEQVIEEVIAGQDLLVLMPTGGGKSITYQVPGLIMGGICLVVSPLISLIKDQVHQLRDRNISAEYLVSGMDYREIDRVLDNCIYGKIKFLYVSPERLKSELFIERFKQMKISFIAVDEAHCISQWGYDFRPAYLEIAEIRRFHPNVGVLALTATATPEVVEDIQDKLLFLRKHVLHRSFYRENLHYIVVEEVNKRERVLRGLKALSGSTIIYVRSRRATREISQWLKNAGISAAPYHAGLTAELKDETQQKWLEGEVRVMVATNAFGMGIDKSNVRLVIHLDLPDAIEAYFQEAGRAGRDGLRAHAVLLYNDTDIAQLEERIGWSFPPIDTIKNVYNDMGSFYRLAFGSGLNETFPFDIAEFSQRYDFKIFDVYSSLRILEREGYLFMNESLHQPSKVKLKVNQSELYYFEVANSKLEPMIKTLLRSYSGLFDEYRKINEYLLAKRLRLPVEKVIDQLKYLDKVKLLDYLPANQGPQITWLVERLPKTHLRISYEQYGLLKERQEKRAEAFIKYLKTDVCRNRQLLAYFGEETAKDCGKCDVCLKNAMRKAEMKTMEDAMVKVLKGGPVSLQVILSSVPKLKEEWALEMLRYYADEGVIIKDDENRWKWVV